MMNKLFNFGLDIFRNIFIFIFSCILLLIVFNSKIDLFKLLFFSLIIFVAIYFLNKYSKLINLNKQYIIFGFIFLQLLSILFLTVTPSWDFGQVFSTSYNMAVGGLSDFQFSTYYTLFPNNIGAVLLLYLPFKLLSLITTNVNLFIIAGSIFNLLIIDSSLVLVYKSFDNFKLLSDKHKSVFFAFLFIVSPFVTYVTIFYTDTLSMVFPAISLYLLSKSNFEKGIDIKIIFSIISCIIGSLIKTNLLIVLIAQLIYLAYKLDLKKYTLVFIVAIIIFACFSMTLSNFHSIKTQVNDVKPVPFTHWIYMGSNGNGGYNEADYNYTRDLLSKYSVSDVKKIHINETVERYKNKGISGSIDFLIKKVDYTWNDGMFFAPHKLSRRPLSPDSLYYNKIMANNGLYQSLCISGQLILFFGILLSCIQRIRKKIDIVDFINIAIFGNFIFLLFWETRSRYLVYALPLFVFASVCGYVKLLNSKKN